MVLLIADGPSYRFHALAFTKVDADKVFRQAWKRHVKQTGADQDPENAVTINYITGIECNQVYRDYERL